MKDARCPAWPPRPAWCCPPAAGSCCASPPGTRTPSPGSRPSTATPGPIRIESGPSPPMTAHLGRAARAVEIAGSGDGVGAATLGQQLAELHDPVVDVVPPPAQPIRGQYYYTEDEIDQSRACAPPRCVWRASCPACPPCCRPPWGPWRRVRFWDRLVISSIWEEYISFSGHADCSMQHLNFPSPSLSTPGPLISMYQWVIFVPGRDGSLAHAAQHITRVSDHIELAVDGARQHGLQHGAGQGWSAEVGRMSSLT